MRCISLAALAMTAAAVPMSQMVETAVEFRLDAAAEISMAQLTEQIAATAVGTFGHEVDVSVDSKRRLQGDSTTGLRIKYTVLCGSACDAVNAALLDPAVRAAHASALVAAITSVATSAGFPNGLLSTAADITATITDPVLVTVTIPTAPTAPVMIIKGVLDLQTPQRGASGKSIQLLAITDVPDLSVFGLGVANNGKCVLSTAPHIVSTPCSQYMYGAQDVWGASLLARTVR